MIAEEFWWNSITGPRRVASKVLEALKANKMVLLKVPDDLPWRHAMRGCIEQQFRETSDSYDILIDSLDAVDEVTETDPGTFLLDKYSAHNEDVQVGFREKRNYHIQDYLKDNKVLNNRVIWIKGMTGDQVKAWADFCEQYSIKALSEGCFVMEVHGKLPNEAYKNIEIVSYEDYVTDYDVQSFNSVYLNETSSYGIEWKQYLAILAATVCGSDAEFSKAFIDEGDFKHDEVKDMLYKLAESGDFARRGNDKESQHILSYVRKKDETAIERRIWKAQMQILFPLIELERIKLIEKWEDNISRALQENRITQYGKQIYEPFDVELGTLDYYMHKYQENSRWTYISINDASDRRRIEFLHECRNILAHVGCCSTEQVVELLK